mgnify:CR=1 FL=1
MSGCYIVALNCKREERFIYCEFGTIRFAWDDTDYMKLTLEKTHTTIHTVDGSDMRGLCGSMNDNSAGMSNFIYLMKILIVT